MLTQHYLACLSHASYLVADESTSRAVVVDPRRDANVYADDAAAAGLTIERVIGTHLHADFLSGHLERDVPVVYCAGGSRGVVAVSVLRHAGYGDVSDLLGGYTAWTAAGEPTAR